MAYLAETRKVAYGISGAILCLFLAACGGGGGGGGGETAGSAGEWVRETIASYDFSSKAAWSFTGNVDSPTTGSAILWKANGSLNYNDGIDYETLSNGVSKWNWGKAASPKFALDDSRNVRLGFSCRYHIDPAETGLLKYDQRSVEVHLYLNGAAMTLAGGHRILLYPKGHPRAQENPIKPAEFQEMISCPGGMLTEHLHTVDLEPIRGLYGLGSWDKVDVRIVFTFDTKDEKFNQGWGWSVDDFDLSGEYLW